MIKETDSRLKTLPLLKNFVNNSKRYSTGFVSTNSIETTKKEIEELENALNSVKDDYYSEALSLRYLHGKTDEYIAEVLNCDVSTVRRNRNRLLKKISVILYGVEAITKK